MWQHFQKISKLDINIYMASIFIIFSASVANMFGQVSEVCLILAIIPSKQLKWYVSIQIILWISHNVMQDSQTEGAHYSANYLGPYKKINSDSLSLSSLFFRWDVTSLLKKKKKSIVEQLDCSLLWVSFSLSLHPDTCHERCDFLYDKSLSLSSLPSSSFLVLSVCSFTFISHTPIPLPVLH